MHGLKLLATIIAIAFALLLMLPLGSIADWLLKEYRGNDRRSRGDSGDFTS